jgi:hypothetical protein
MLEEFYEEDKLHGGNLRKKPKALEYSVLHRWFIFIKKGLTDTPTQKLTKDEESEIMNPNFNSPEKDFKNKNRFEWKPEDMLDNIQDTDNEETDNEDTDNTDNEETDNTDNEEIEELSDDIPKKTKDIKVNKVEPRKQQKGGNESFNESMNKSMNKSNNELFIEELDLETIKI